MSTCGSTVCIIKEKEIVSGSIRIKLKGVKCIASFGHFLVVALENKTLNIYDNDKLVKELSNFTDKPIAEMHVMGV